MKRFYLIFIILTISASVFAKKVKFAVDMTGQSISINGVHVTGDFISEAGYGNDWEGIVPMVNEAETSIYSVIVDIPAFTKYEYKFMNGDQFYELEFVPVESRVGYDYVDNRWLYVDSLQNDTTFVGAILFGANAPAGLNLVRFSVNMQYEDISGEGVHIAGTYNAWISERLCNLSSGIYEIIQYISPGDYQYSFYNGNTDIDIENPNTECMTDGKRSVTFSNDIVLSTVCFSQCSDCAVGISEKEICTRFTVYPNPTKDFIIIKTNIISDYSVFIYNAKGEIIYTNKDINFHDLMINNNQLSEGVNFVNIKGVNICETFKVVKL